MSQQAQEFSRRFALAVKHAGFYATPDGLHGALNPEWTKNESSANSRLLSYYLQAAPIVASFLSGKLQRQIFVSTIRDLRADQLNRVVPQKQPLRRGAPLFSGARRSGERVYAVFPGGEKSKSG